MKNIPKALWPKLKWKEKEKHREERSGGKSSSTCMQWLNDTGHMAHGTCSRALQPKARNKRQAGGTRIAHSVGVLHVCLC